ncbi:MAG: 30S ribosomal protein S20 [Acidobacteriota bacterium]|nr:30S ribosomal protein S20 [Blastocatellia bacterium]MDW8412306.1 30S ribosomal protein S20 [Acidobacteriota bacterium]
MPNHPSAAKRDRQAERRRSFNRRNLRRMRTEIKKLRAAIAAAKKDSSQSQAAEVAADLAAKRKEELQSMLRHVVSIIDRTAAKGVIHRNAAARYKSRLTVKFNQLMA